MEKGVYGYRLEGGERASPEDIPGHLGQEHLQREEAAGRPAAEV